MARVFHGGACAPYPPASDQLHTERVRKTGSKSLPGGRHGLSADEPDPVLAAWLVARGAHYHFTVKDNQKILAQDLRTHFRSRGAPDYAEPVEVAHGRIEKRRIWCTTALNNYLEFPHVGQAWLIERERTDKKTGHRSCEAVVGVTSRTPREMTPHKVLAINRGHWSIESLHYLIDWNYDEDRGRIRTGHGPANVTRLRRFAIGLLKTFQTRGQSIAQMMRQLARRPRQVLDYLRLTANSTGASRTTT